MKKLLTFLALIFLTTTSAQAKDPCASVLCMAGMFQGSGVVSGCSKPVKDYFSIIKFKKNGAISFGKTAKARGKFLNQCSSNGGWGDKINNRYGRVLQ